MKNIFGKIRGFWRAKISRKIASMCVLLAMMICVGCCISGYIQYRDTIYQRYNNFAYQIAGIARSYVNGDRIATYLDTGKTDEEYDLMAQQIYNIYRQTALYENKSGIYIFVPDGENATITNLFDVRIIEASEETKPFYAIGCKDPMGVEHPEHVMEIFNTGATVDDYFVHETKFGYNSTAVLQITDSNGTPVACLAADMPIPFINETLNHYLLMTVLVTVLIVIIFMGMFLLIIQHTVTHPIHELKKGAEILSGGDLNHRLNISTGDEIEGLSKAFNIMAIDLDEYMTNLTRVTAEKERIGAELDVATHIQASMLPNIFPAFPERQEFDIYAAMDPAKEVGGDFYDFFMVDDRHIAIVVADVSGKGVPAALFMVIGKTLIKDHTQLNRSLSDVFTEVNNLLCESNSEGLFITAFEGVLNLETGEFNYVNAGHEMPFIYRREKGQYEAYKMKPGFVLAGMEDMKFRGGSITLNVGDKIFQYTDGVTEATDKDNGLYGMERLERILNTCQTDSPKETLDKVRRDIDTFVGDAPQFDDLTMLCLEYKQKYQPEDAR